MLAFIAAVEDNKFYQLGNERKDNGSSCKQENKSPLVSKCYLNLRCRYKNICVRMHEIVTAIRWSEI
jgi:hypothetical protein